MDTTLLALTAYGSVMAAVLAALSALQRCLQPAGAGGSFTVLTTLPRAPQDGSLLGNGPRRPETGRVLLIVDDEDMVREVSSRMAMRLGYRVLTAADGIEAVEVFRRHGDTVACVILDVRMPRLDGIATFGVLRGLRQDVPIILCSGYCEPAEAERLAGKGVSAFLAKPFVFAHFRDVLQRTLAD